MGMTDAENADRGGSKGGKSGGGGIGSDHSAGQSGGSGKGGGGIGSDHGASAGRGGPSSSGGGGGGIGSDRAASGRSGAGTSSGQSGGGGIGSDRAASAGLGSNRASSDFNGPNSGYSGGAPTYSGGLSPVGRTSDFMGPNSSYSGGPPTFGGGLMSASTVTGYQQAADSMLSVGVGNVAGKLGLSESFVDSIADKIIGVESNYNPTAKNPLSTATGLGQFTEGTWLGTVAKHAPEVMVGKTKAEVLAMRTDPVLSRAMTAAYAQDNLQALAKQGVPATAAGAYLGHFLGPDTAAKTYNAPPDTPMSSLVSAEAIAANRSILSGKTAGDVVGWAAAKMADSPKASVSLPDRVSVPEARPGNLPDRAPTPTSRPEERFSRTYLDGVREYERAAKAVGAPGISDYRTTEAYTRAASTMAEAGIGGIGARNDNKSYGGTSPDRPDNRDYAGPKGLGGPGGLNLGSAETPAAKTTPADRFKETYIAPRTNAAPAVTAEKPAAAKPARTTGQKIAAGAIDIATGFIPGPVGIGAGLFNAGAQITGNRTIGDRIVDGFADGGFKGTPHSPTQEAGDAVERPSRSNRAPSETTVAKEAEEAVERFVGIYLDTSNRRTPKEKWGGRLAA